MSNVVTFIIGLVMLLGVWLVLRTIAKFIQSIIYLKDSNDEILEQLEEIKAKLEEMQKNNSDK